MNKFRVSRPIPSIDSNQELGVQKFEEGAVLREQGYVGLNKEDKPLKSFTVPLNDYELDLLRRAAKKDDRSQRYMARQLLVNALEVYLKENDKIKL